MRGRTEIRTPRLLLRKLRREDAPAIVDGVGDLVVSKWLSNVPHPYGLADAEWFLENMGARPDHWAITRDGDFLGVMSIGAELGYWLKRDAWGQGIATEAGFAVVGAWFERSGHDLLTSGYFEGNGPSGAVLSKIGFELSGERLSHSKSLGRTVRRQDVQLTRAKWEAGRRLPCLSTPRLRSRLLKEADAARLVEIAGIPEVARNTSSIPAPWSETAARAWVGRRDWRDRPGFRLALCDRSGCLVGMAGLSPMDEKGEASLAYFIEKSLWGRGLASEFVAAMIPAIFDSFGVNTITADHFTDNPASGAVLRKTGFRPAGTGMGQSLARLEPAPLSLYRLERSSFEADR